VNTVKIDIAENLRNVIQITKTQLEKIGQYFVGKIRADALDGKMQNNTANHSYSPAYAKLKAKGMTTQRRQPKGEQPKKKRKSKKPPKEKRMEQYKSLPLNRDTSKVNLTLTGKMLKSLDVIKSKTTYNSVTLGYGQDQSGKVLGNKAKGYDVTQLSDENIAIARELIETAIKENLKNSRGKKQVIKI